MAGKLNSAAMFIGAQPDVFPTTTSWAVFRAFATPLTSTTQMPLHTGTGGSSLGAFYLSFGSFDVSSSACEAWTLDTRVCARHSQQFVETSLRIRWELDPALPTHQRAHLRSSFQKPRKTGTRAHSH